MAFWIRSLLLAMVIMSLLHLFKHPLLRAGITYGTPYLTGVDVRVGQVGVDMIRSDLKEGSVVMRDVVFSRAGKARTARAFLKFSKVYGRYRLKPLAAGKLHFKTLWLHIERLHVIRSEDGEVTLDMKPLPIFFTEGKERLKVDFLGLEIQTVIFRDYLSETHAAEVIEYEIETRLRERYHHVSGIEELGKIILERVSEEERAAVHY